MAKAKQPELIRIINSKKRKLEINYGWNTCEIRLEIDGEYSDITLNEFEARKLHNGLSRFLEYRKQLRDDI